MSTRDHHSPCRQPPYPPLGGVCDRLRQDDYESGVDIVEDGKLTVCTHLPYEPFQFKKGGEVVGFDVDLMDLVAEDLELEQEIVNTPFETIETGQAMATGKCDIAAAGMTITEERDQVIDFSDPYFEATQALLVTKGAGTTHWSPSTARPSACRSAPPVRSTPTTTRRKASSSRCSRTSRCCSRRSRAAASMPPSTTTPCCSTTPPRTPTPR